MIVPTEIETAVETALAAALVRTAAGLAECAQALARIEIPLLLVASAVAAAP